MTVLIHELAEAPFCVPKGRGKLLVWLLFYALRPFLRPKGARSK